jgi:hypothetical protein
MLAAVDAAFLQLRVAGAKALFRFAYDRAEVNVHNYSAATIMGRYCVFARRLAQCFVHACALAKITTPYYVTTGKRQKNTRNMRAMELIILV